MGGGSARHLSVANALCQAGEVPVIVWETGSEWSLMKILKKMRPDQFFRNIWRWLRGWRLAC